MLALDLQSLSLASPQNLTLAAAGAVALILLVAGIKSRQPLGARYAALALRLVVLAALGVALASPSVTAQIEERFAPQGVWNLAADGTVAGVTNFSARVRNAFAQGKPPSLIEISGKPAHARAAAALLEPLGVPVRVEEEAEVAATGPVLVGVDCPALLSPGEPLTATLHSAGRGGEVRFSVDGAEVARKPLDANELAWPQLALDPGRHVITAELFDAAGNSIQRIGHVLRVGDMPRLIALGMTAGEFARLETLAPNYQRRSIEVKDFSKAQLLEAELVVLPIIAGLDMTDRQAHALMQFAANGGGVLITADGAEHVAPEMLSSELRELMPVRLMQQPQTPPPEPPVKEEIGKAEVAAVSIMYVIDRSTSMEARVGKATRWDVAVEAVRKSLEKLDLWDRASVMAFTLKRTWMPRPQVVAPFDRELIARQLRDLEPDNEYDPRGYNTDIYKAVEEALDVLEKEPSAVKMLVLLTDGGDRDDDGGKVRNHRALAERAISKKINIVTLGIGDGFYDTMGATSARRLINDVATRPEYAYIAPDAKTAEVAPVVFVRAVELAYEAYSDEMARRELEKKKRATDQPDKPPVVEVAKGEYPLEWTVVGQQLLGSEIPKPAPRLAKYALTRLREHSANAITLGSVANDKPALLTLGGYALGRVAFWASGLDNESLGGVGQWKDFPRFYAQLVRWLQPRNEPDPRLISGATRAGIGLIDPIAEARYSLRNPQGGEVPLVLENGELRAAAGLLPDGSAEVIERVGSEERHIGDAFIAARPEAASVSRVLDVPPQVAALSELPPVVRTSRREAFEPILALLIAALCLMPIERFIRRRS